MKPAFHTKGGGGKMVLGKRGWAALALAAILPGNAAAFGGFAKIGRSFSRAAFRAGIPRVAVLPFRPLDGSDSREGLIIAEEITQEIAKRGRVQLVERALLSGIMGEHQLGLSGALDRESLARIEKLLQARAVVTGTYIIERNRIEVFARLVDIETGALLAARSYSRKRRFFTAAREPPLVREERELRDSLAADPCAGAEERITSIEESVFSLKVRYWAEQVRREGSSLMDTWYNVSDTMIDPKAGLAFRRMITKAVLYGSPPLDPEEVQYFITKDSEAFLLKLKCKISLPLAEERFGG